MEYELDPTIVEIVRLACQLGACDIGGPLSEAELLVARTARSSAEPDDACVANARKDILRGGDPLGTAYEAAKTRRSRQRGGVFYTDPSVVSSMVRWVLATDPQQVVDAGCGSGRFAAAIAKTRPNTPIIALDIDPVATLICRATLGISGASQFRVANTDFTTAQIERIQGHTAFLGNPPYVRHHDLRPRQKAWLSSEAAGLGIKFSQLGGLHTHFFLATALHAQPGDVGCYITNAEWLDTNYGAGPKSLLLNRLGLQSLHIFDDTAVPFHDAMTTAVISCFRVGADADSIRVKQVRSTRELGALNGGSRIMKSRLPAKARWSSILNGNGHRAKEGWIQLGDVAEVHRGMVTGANSYFVMSRDEARERGLMKFVRPVLTSAREVINSGGQIRAEEIVNVVLAPPKDVDLSREPELASYLKEGSRKGVPETYVCSHRKPWWYMAFKAAPPMVVTYMARQTPTFATNADGIAILNVLHGIHPRTELIDLSGFVSKLNCARATYQDAGRIYHGGLQKLEPREMENLLVPPP